MHNNYYFLKQLSDELEGKIVGYIVEECFSQNKDELIIRLRKSEKAFVIKASLDSSFCCLSFPENFYRSKKNSVDLFTDIIDREVIKVEQYINERAFSIWLNHGYQLIFKMHGNRSNVLLATENQVIQIFNNRLIKDLELIPDLLHRLIKQTKQTYIDGEGNLKQLFPTFGKEVITYFEDLNAGNTDLEKKWIIIEKILEELNRNKFHFSSSKFSLFPFNNCQVLTSPIEAINSFFHLYISNKQLNVEKNRALGPLRKRITSTEMYLTKTSKKLQDLTENTNYQILGDLLMANLHAINPGLKEITLTNFYDEEKPISIKLKPNLSPQKNAEALYRKSKNQSIEIEKLQDNIANKKKLLTFFKEALNSVHEQDDLKKLRKYLKENNLVSDSKHEEIIYPYNEFEFDSYRIWVGKSAINNDKMLHLAFKEDLWLHAKDVSGSHVIIKYESARKFSSAVKEKAAELAAYYSKRKSDSLCPVIITPRKYIRKRKGDPAGAVVVDKEETILVTPCKWT